MRGDSLVTRYLIEVNRLKWILSPLWSLAVVQLGINTLAITINKSQCHKLNILRNPAARMNFLKKVPPAERTARIGLWASVRLSWHEASAFPYPLVKRSSWSLTCSVKSVVLSPRWWGNSGLRSTKLQNSQRNPILSRHHNLGVFLTWTSMFSNSWRIFSSCSLWSCWERLSCAVISTTSSLPTASMLANHMLLLAEDLQYSRKIGWVCKS